MIASIIICALAFFGLWAASFVVGLLLASLNGKVDSTLNAIGVLAGLFLMWLGWLPAGVITAIVAWNMGW